MNIHLVFTQFSYTMSEWKILNIQLLVFFLATHTTFSKFWTLQPIDPSRLNYLFTVWWRNTMCIIVYNYQSSTPTFLYFFLLIIIDILKTKLEVASNNYDLNTEKGSYGRLNKRSSGWIWPGMASALFLSIHDQILYLIFLSV